MSVVRYARRIANLVTCHLIVKAMLSLVIHVNAADNVWILILDAMYINHYGYRKA